MIYADYAYYTGTWHGTAIRETDFPRLALLASNFLDYYTQGRAAKSPDLEALKMACCALAEQYQAIETAKALAQKSLAYSMESKGAEVSSETVGSWTKSFRSGGDSTASAKASMDAYKAELADIALQYLAGTGLVYRGGRCCACRCSYTL